MYNCQAAIRMITKFLVCMMSCLCIRYRVTQKTGTFEKPNKNWRNPRKKIYWQKM